MGFKTYTYGSNIVNVNSGASLLVEVNKGLIGVSKISNNLEKIQSEKLTRQKNMEVVNSSEKNASLLLSNTTNNIINTTSSQHVSKNN